MAILKKVLILILAAHFAKAQNLATTLNIADKKPLAFSSLSKYQVFYFWATWCPDCKEKITSDLSAFKNSNLDFLAVATDKDAGKVADYLVANNVSVPIYIDEKKELQKFFKVFSVPTVVLAEKTDNSFHSLLQVTGADWSEIKSKMKELK